MKKVLTSVFILLFFTNCEKPSDCIKSSGQLASKFYEGLIFDKILVNKRITLVIIQGDIYKVEVKTGENLINDIEVKVADNTLTLEDNTTCNWVRDYGETVVYVTSPNLTDVICKTEKDITSNGVLRYPYLHLVSMNEYDGYKGIGTGDFKLDLDCQKIFIENNDVSRYFISGNTNELSINFYDHGGIFHGENLTSNTISVYHRGSNDIFLLPIQSIIGDIYNVGNVICTSRPPLIQVMEHYKGRLIFK